MNTTFETSKGEAVGFCEDTALSLAERTFSTEIDEQLAEDIIQYAQRLHGLYTAPQTAPEATKLVDAAEMALKEIEHALNDAYNSARPVCCQRPSFGECCGNPDPEWPDADKSTMDRFAPHYRALKDAIRAYRTKVVDL